MYGPTLLVDVVAALLLASALYCSGRLTFLVATKRPDRRDIHVVHVVMAPAMAAMILRIVNFSMNGAWEIVFLAFAGWFIWRADRALRAAPSTSGFLHELNHMLASAAMVIMFAGGMVMRGSSMKSMAAASSPPYWFAPAAVLCMVALAGYGVWNVTRIVTMTQSTLATDGGTVGSGAAPSFSMRGRTRQALGASRLALCCDVVMAGSMVYMFAWIH